MTDLKQARSTMNFRAALEFEGCDSCLDRPASIGPTTCAACGRSSGDGRFFSLDSNADPAWETSTAIAADREAMAWSIPLMLAKWSAIGCAASLLTIFAVWLAAAPGR